LGVNVTASVHDDLGATVAGRPPHVPVPLRVYSEADEVALEMTSEVVLPVLWTVRVFVTELLIGTLPNESEVGATVMVGGAGVGVAVGVGVGDVLRGSLYSSTRLFDVSAT
jgi:hypothetical protein